MATITLYPPNGELEEYEVETIPRVDSAGVLRFQADGNDVVTNVPFLVRSPVNPKVMVKTTQQRPARRTSSSSSQWR